jgi:hypothetical protein
MTDSLEHRKKQLTTGFAGVRVLNMLMILIAVVPLMMAMWFTNAAYEAQQALNAIGAQGNITESTVSSFKSRRDWYAASAAFGYLGGLTMLGLGLYYVRTYNLDLVDV